LSAPSEEPQRAIQRLEERDRRRVEFLAMASHELRTPITAIRGFARMLIRNRRALSEDEATGFLEIIERQTDRLARLAEDLLLVSRVEAHAIRPALREVSVSEFLREAVEPFAVDGAGRIRLAVPAKPRVVWIDPELMARVLGNLVHNALKFSPGASEVAVEASVGASELTICVTDEGAGIPQEELDRVFDRFHQGSPSCSDDPGGAGLGLYIAKQLVDGMGGTISVRSAAGRGSTFTVALPLRGR
jgi:signal transduction histidine kinase